MAIGSPRETMFFIRGLYGYCLTTYNPDLLVFYKPMNISNKTLMTAIIMVGILSAKEGWMKLLLLIFQILVIIFA